MGVVISANKSELTGADNLVYILLHKGYLIPAWIIYETLANNFVVVTLYFVYLSLWAGRLSCWQHHWQQGPSLVLPTFHQRHRQNFYPQSTSGIAKDHRVQFEWRWQPGFHRSLIDTGHRHCPSTWKRGAGVLGSVWLTRFDTAQQHLQLTKYILSYFKGKPDVDGNYVWSDKI